MPRIGKTTVDALKCPDGHRDRLVFDDELPGFGVRVTSTGRKIYLLQYRIAGVRRRMPLGVHGQVTPSQARRAAIEARGLIVSGRDPLLELKARASAALPAKDAPAMTLGELVARWAAGALETRRPAYAREAPRAVRAGLVQHLERAAAALSDDDAQAAIDRIAADRPIMARRTRDYARALFNWGVRRRLVERNPFATVEIEGREVSRDRVLSDRELGDLWNAARELGPVARGLILVLVLTLQRRSEVAGMRWDEVDLRSATWTIPAARSKNRRAHLVHLVPEARTAIEAVPRRDVAGRASPFVFTTTGTTALSGLSKVKRQLDARMTVVDRAAPDLAITASWRFHDLRRTGVTRLAQMGVPPQVADRLLNHVEGVIHGVAAVYQRHEYLDERMHALERWRDHVLRCAAEASRSNVIVLEERRTDRNT